MHAFTIDILQGIKDRRIFRTLDQRELLELLISKEEERLKEFKDAESFLDNANETIATNKQQILPENEAQYLKIIIDGAHFLFDCLTHCRENQQKDGTNTFKGQVESPRSQTLISGLKTLSENADFQAVARQLLSAIFVIQRFVSLKQNNTRQVQEIILSALHTTPNANLTEVLSLSLEFFSILKIELEKDQAQIGKLRAEEENAAKEPNSKESSSDDSEDNHSESCGSSGSGTEFEVDSQKILTWLQQHRVDRVEHPDISLLETNSTSDRTSPSKPMPE